MDKQEKIRFVTHLMLSVKDKVFDAINDEKIPEEWDGHELRQYLADKFSEAAYVRMDAKRKREYTNTVLVNNL